MVLSPPYSLHAVQAYSQFDSPSGDNSPPLGKAVSIWAQFPGVCGPARPLTAARQRVAVFADQEDQSGSRSFIGSRLAALRAVSDSYAVECHHARRLSTARSGREPPPAIQRPWEGARACGQPEGLSRRWASFNGPIVVDGGWAVAEAAAVWRVAVPRRLARLRATRLHGAGGGGLRRLRPFLSCRAASPDRARTR